MALERLKTQWATLLAAKPTFGMDASRWMKDSGVQVYGRYARRLVNGEFLAGAVIATISVPEKKQKQGLFADFLRYTEEIVAADPGLNFVIIENPHNPHLWGFLERNGYMRKKDGQQLEGYEDYIKLFISSQEHQPEPAASGH